MTWDRFHPHLSKMFSPKMCGFLNCEYSPVSQSGLIFRVVFFSLSFFPWGSKATQTCLCSVSKLGLQAGQRSVFTALWGFVWCARVGVGCGDTAHNDSEHVQLPSALTRLGQCPVLCQGQGLPLCSFLKYTLLIMEQRLCKRKTLLASLYSTLILGSSPCPSPAGPSPCGGWANGGQLFPHPAPNLEVTVFQLCSFSTPEPCLRCSDLLQSHWPSTGALLKHQQRSPMWSFIFWHFPSESLQVFAGGDEQFLRLPLAWQGFPWLWALFRCPPWLCGLQGSGAGPCHWPPPWLLQRCRCISPQPPGWAAGVCPGPGDGAQWAQGPGGPAGGILSSRRWAGTRDPPRAAVAATSFSLFCKEKNINNSMPESNRSWAPWQQEGRDGWRNLKKFGIKVL